MLVTYSYDRLYVHVSSHNTAALPPPSEPLQCAQGAEQEEGLVEAQHR